MNKSLTIFTPTFNRVNLLPNLYSCLEKQTDLDFTWLIIDDGSIDSTEDFVNNLIIENKIDIEYYKKENNGKHSAYNLALDLIETPFFICVDSDDYLDYEAVRIIKNEISTITDNHLGVYFIKKNMSISNLTIDYTALPRDLFLMELYTKYKSQDEMAIVFNTNKVKHIVFPIFDGENFMDERVVYLRLNDLGKMRLVPKVIYYYEYLPEGLTKKRLSVEIKNPKGVALLYLLSSKYYSFFEGIKFYAMYVAWSRLYNLSISKNKDIKFIRRILSKFLVSRYYRIFNVQRDKGNE